MMHSFLRASRIALGLGLFLLAFCVVSLAQTGSITGTVTDAQGAVVQKAEINVKNTATGITRSATSSEEGVYKITDLAPGVYELTVKATGFKTFLVPDATVTVAQALSVNPKLEPGAITEEVQVRADQLPDLDFESAQVSNLVGNKTLTNLPLITRNPYELVLLSPGTSQTNALGGISVNGARERNNNFLLDGVDNNDTSVPGNIGGVLSADPESTQEFRVITNSFNAEYGRNTGAIVDVVTKSGTNSLHFDAYEFGRWNGFGGARDWFNRQSDGPQDPYIRHQFGYSVGGPIIKDKTFFFFNQEFQRFVTTLTGFVQAPTAAFRTGVFNYTYNDDLGTHTVPVDLTPSGSNNLYGLPLDPTMQEVFSKYPVPNSSADGLSGFVFYPSSSRQKSYQATAKIDHNITSKQLLTLRYGYDPFSDPNPFHDDILPGNVGATASKGLSQGLLGSLTSTFTPTLINTFNFGWNRIAVGFQCTGLDTLDSPSPLDQFGNGRDYNMAPFTSFGCLSLVSDGQFRKTGTTSYGDNLSWVRGSHTFKFGGDFRQVHESGPNGFFSRRQVSTNTFSLFGDPAVIGFNLIDVPGVTDVPGLGISISNAASALYGFVPFDQYAEFFDKNGVRKGTDDKSFIQHEYDFYGQDTWKFRPNLTFTVGLRYQFDGVPFEQDANFSNVLGSLTGAPVVLSVVGPGTGKQIYKDDYSNLEPRIGFSWDPWSNGKTAVRGAFGIFHDRVFGNLFGNARGNPPFEQDYVQQPFETINDAFGSGAFPVIPPDTTPSLIIPDGSLLAPVVFDTHFRNPVSNNWNFGIQREITNAMSVDVSYVGSYGYHVFRQLDGNPPDPNLVQALLDFCVPGNSFTNINGQTVSCTQGQVQGLNLYEGYDDGRLPFNAVAHNAVEQPFYQVSNGISHYDGLQLKVTHHVSHGLELQGAYTWSHARDDSSDPLAPALGNRTYPRNSRVPRQDYGNSDNDVRHVAVISYIWEVPLGKGKSFLNTGVLGKVFEGMQFSGLTTLQTGHPFEVRGRNDSQRTGIAAWADLVGDPFGPGANDSLSNNLGNKVFFSNPDAFSSPPIGSNRPGTTGRNQFYGPGFVNFDLAWSKKVMLTERLGLVLRCEGYNIFNHPHFNNPGNLVDSPGAFGIITSTVGRPDATTSARQLQAAIKITF